ncbi:MAG TPA: hypothetical protein VMM17_09610 [Gemmatimonadaceae bacterium]|nr:hypothetical protein [Gemmatimonadaceae bacterium]
MRAWLTYAGASLLVAVVGAGLATLFAAASAVRAIWFAALLAWLLQLAAFAALIAVRERSELFLIGWLGGLVLRFGVVGVVAFWLSRSDVLPLAPTLLSLVAFVFVLLLMEPIFLRRGLQTR